MYAFFLSYLAAPVVGIPLDSGHIVDFVHQLPEWAKLSGKTVLAAPFVYHSLNGVRHLAWDVTKGQFCAAFDIIQLMPSLLGLGNTAVKRSGYAVLAGTLVGTAALVMI